MGNADRIARGWIAGELEGWAGTYLEAGDAAYETACRLHDDPPGVEVVMLYTHTWTAIKHLREYPEEESRMATDKDPRPCTEGGQKHRVDQRELQEAESNPDGGTVHCMDCGKALPRGPRNLEFRGEVGA
jgi:hypothetical protein